MVINGQLYIDCQPCLITNEVLVKEHFQQQTVPKCEIVLIFYICWGNVTLPKGQNTSKMSCVKSYTIKSLLLNW